MNYVLDASALMAYFEEQHRYELVSEALSKASQSDKPVLMTTVNWGEVYYLALRKPNQNAAALVASAVLQLPIQLVAPDIALTQLAGEIKHAHHLAYMDAFAAALAKQNKATLITADHDFRTVQEEINILWL